MKFSDLVIVLPCNGLEDLSLDREAAEAEELLSAYSALWHPALLVSAQAVPRWVRAEDPPQEPSGHLFIIPGVCDFSLPPDWPSRAEAAGACLVRGQKHRDEMVAAALAQLDGGDGGVDPQLARDFLALGYGHLLVELLTRQLRYMSNLDEIRFRSEAVAAAEAALGGDADRARDHLRAAFEQLTQAREYFYPVEAYLIDLTLVAPSTLGAALRAELSGPEPVNLLVSAATLQRAADQEPETLAALREALERGTAALIGGGMDDAPLPLLPVEAVLEHLRRGLAVCDRLLGRRPAVFGRRRFGLTPVLPQIVQSLGLQGVFHCTLDDGRFPSGNQSKVRWEGLDGTVVEALARIPLDVTQSDNFLRLPSKLGDTLDLDHTATAIMAHWPGQSSPWLEDLKRIVQYSPVVGRFVTVDHYFEQTRMAGQQKTYSPDEYRPPYLRQDVAAAVADPVSRWVRYYRRRAALDSLKSLSCLADMVSGKASDGDALDPFRDEIGREVSGIAPSDAQLSTVGAADAPSDLDRRLDEARDEALKRFARSLPRSTAMEKSGLLLVNPASFARRLWADATASGEPPSVGGPIQTAEVQGGRVRLAVDVPPLGFVWIGPGQSFADPEREAPPKTRWIPSVLARKKETPPLAEEHVLRNEHFEARLDPATGALRSLGDYRTRGSRFAQQIAMRIPQARSRDEFVEEGSDTDYTIMAADEFRVASAGPAVGEVVVRGRLVARNGTRVAGFVETLRCRRGSRTLEIEIELDVDRLPGPDPWDSYYACRFAWSEFASEVLRSVNGLTCRTDARLIHSPYFVDVRGMETRTTILAGGLPYHRRFGTNKLDTLLVVGGETARRFRLGLAVDARHPLPAAQDFLAPAAVMAERACPPQAVQGWLFHLDARNVVATAWAPVASGTAVAGFRVRLLETEGRKAEVHLRSFRPMRDARRVDFSGQTVMELAVEEDRATINLGPHQYVEVEATFA